MENKIIEATRVYRSQFDDNDNEYSGTKLRIDSERLSALSRELEEIEGQEYACQGVKEYLFGIGHRPHEKGLGGSFLFAGAPAVGKTVMAEKIARSLNRPFLRIDMSTKNDKESSVFDLFGIHPSYKAAEEGELTKFVKENPVSVVLLDECEKAHLNVLNTLLQVYERGEIEDKFTKRLVSFRDVILIATTNAGSQIYNQSACKYIFSGVSESTLARAIQTEESPITGKPFFTEALVSRFFSGKVIMFNKLRPQVLRKIVSRDIEKQRRYFEELYGIKIGLNANEVSQLLILNQGENGDIRGLIKSSGELFYKCMGCGTETAYEKDSALLFNRLNIEIDKSDATSEVKSLLNRDGKLRVLVYCNEADKDKYLKYESKGIEVVFADHTFNAKEISVMDITAAIIDVGEGDSRDARRLFDICAGQESIPTYVYSNENVGRSYFYYYVENGAGECFSPRLKGEELEDFIKRIVDGVDLEAMCGALFRASKVVNYDVDYIFNKEEDSITVRLHALRAEMAMDARDTEQFVAKRDIPNVKYEDVIGATGAKAELKRAAKFVLNYKKYLRQGVRIPRGILLEGEPGTGKTMLAKAFANEAGVPFIQKNASEFLIKWIGDGAKAIRELFQRARKYAPCVVFIDEIDVIAKSRVDNAQDYHHTHNLTNAFLSEMDGFKDNTRDPVFVICATNFSTKKGSTHLDEAFLRRFDKKIQVELPKREERAQFLSYALKKLGQGADVSQDTVEQISKRSIGWSLADLNVVIQNAVRKYEDDKGTVGVDNEYLLEEFDGFGNGERRRRSQGELEKTAIHEAGHAALADVLGLPAVYTTIVSRGDFGGYVYNGDEDKTCYTKEELLNKVCMLLGGRAAEVIEYGSDGINTGASSDVKSATNIALRMYSQLGMGDSLLTFERGKEPEYILAKASELLNEQYERAKDLLKDNWKRVKAVSAALVERNSLSEAELKEVMAKI